MGLFGMSLLTSLITARERSSLSGASMTTAKSRKSTARLLWLPPPRNQTPSASFCDSTRSRGAVAFCTASGTAIAVMLAFGWTLLIVISIERQHHRYEIGRAHV